MKTTHELAKELLALPDIEVQVEMWTGQTPTVVITDYDEDVAMIVPEK